MLTHYQWKTVKKNNFFTCFRIETEYDEYLGANMYETRKQYIYVRGLRNVGKECWMAIMGEERVIDIAKLTWTPKAFWICLQKIHSSYSNKTI